VVFTSVDSSCPRLGFLVDFLSHAAIVGFMAGAAIVIGLQQLKGLLGLSHFTNSTDIVSVIKAVCSALHDPVSCFSLAPWKHYAPPSSPHTSTHRNRHRLVTVITWNNTPLHKTVLDKEHMATCLDTV